MAKPSSTSSFQALIPEVLEEIFVQSGNLSLPLACRRFHLVLNEPIVRLHFCTYALYCGNPRRIRYADISSMEDLQTKMFAKKWFTLDFSAQVERAVLKLQESAYRKRVVKEAILRGKGYYAKKDKVICTYEAKLPRHALSGPWTDARVNFLLRLMRWNTKPHICDRDMASAGMRRAITEGRPEAVKLLSDPVIGVRLDTKLLRLAVIVGGCNKAIVKMFPDAWVEDPASINWGDKMLRQWARKKMNEDDEKGQWLLNLLESDGEDVSEDEYEYYFKTPVFIA